MQTVRFREGADERGTLAGSSTTDSNVHPGHAIGSYRIVRRLGEGGTGFVYLAEHPVIGSRVAIKVLHADLVGSSEVVQRFVREARAANTIRSPHIVPVLDFGVLPDGRYYTVMEYLQGQSLEEILAIEGRLSISRTLELMSQLAGAMQEVHRAGILHRDLKPGNIFVERRRGQEISRILDFGIAKLLEQNLADGIATVAGTLLGTPIYCAPEQAAGSQVTLATDVYGLGAVAYEALTGKAICEGTDLVEILLQKATRQVPPVRAFRQDAPPELADLVDRMLSVHAAARPQSMEEVVRALDEVQRRGWEHELADLEDSEVDQAALTRPYIPNLKHPAFTPSVKATTRCVHAPPVEVPARSGWCCWSGRSWIGASAIAVLTAIASVLLVNHVGAQRDTEIAWTARTGVAARARAMGESMMLSAGPADAVIVEPAAEPVLPAAPAAEPQRKPLAPTPPEHEPAPAPPPTTTHVPAIARTVTPEL